MASLLTPEFVAAAGLPADADGQRALVAQLAPAQDRDLHRRWSPPAGCPARPGVARLVEEAAAAGWALAVASTSAEPSVRAVLEHVVGNELAARLHRLRRRRRAAQEAGAGHLPARAGRGWAPTPTRVVVVEDSRNGLLAADGGRAALRWSRSTATPATRTSPSAALVVSALGDPDGEHDDRARRTASAVPARRARIDGCDLTPAALADRSDMNGRRASLTVEFVVRTIAQTAVDNETYFGDLDAVVGDGDFGYSLARGFEIVLADWDALRPHRRRHVPEEGRR